MTSLIHRKLQLKETSPATGPEMTELPSQSEIRVFASTPTQARCALLGSEPRKSSPVRGSGPWARLAPRDRRVSGVTSGRRHTLPPAQRCRRPGFPQRLPPPPRLQIPRGRPRLAPPAAAAQRGPPAAPSRAGFGSGDQGPSERETRAGRPQPRVHRPFRGPVLSPTRPHALALWAPPAPG